MANTEQAVHHEEHRYFSNDVGHSVGRDPFYSFSRSSKWIKLLHALGQDNNMITKGASVENGEDLYPCNGISSLKSKSGMETQNFLKKNGDIAKLKNNTIGNMQFHKVQERINVETEKCLPGWPLLSPSKVSMQKCKKCPREFCSTINYRRHIRMHRRSLNNEKVSPKTREFLCAFWDELCLDEQKKILSFSDVFLEDVAGTSILRALTSLILRAGFSSLPKSYARAGVSLSDAIQANPPRCPLSAQELFSILDDASEKTFLCAGSAISLQKFVFDGEVGKIALDVKNVIACASFLIEKKLVNSYLVHKDAESLRCQKLLMEEEEAAQNRKAEISERKRLKKLRRLREQKEKVNIDANKGESNGNASDVSADPPSLDVLSKQGPNMPAVESSTESMASVDSCISAENIAESMPEIGSSTESLASVETCTSAENVVAPDNQPEDGDAVADYCSQVESRHSTVSKNIISKTETGSNSFIQGPSAKPAVTKRFFKDSKNNQLANSQLIWTRKSKNGKERVPNKGVKAEEEKKEKADQSDNSAVVIGSMTVQLENSNAESVGQNKLSEASFNLDPIPSTENVELWRPVSRQQKIESSSKKQNELDGSREQSNFNEIGSNTEPLRKTLHSRRQLFSTEVAEAFLAKRWKDALASDHLKFETADTEVRIDDGNSTEQPIPSSSGRSIHGNAENRVATAGGQFYSANNNFYITKLKGNPDKNHRAKYIPKRKA